MIILPERLKSAHTLVAEGCRCRLSLDNAYDAASTGMLSGVNCQDLSKTTPNPLDRNLAP